MAMEGGTFEQGKQFRNRDELVAALKRWIEETNELTVGDLKFKRAPWISFNTPAGVAHLNADTRRDAVERMLRQTSEDGHGTLSGTGTALSTRWVFDLNDSHEGWYAYLRQPIHEPTEI